MKTVCKTVLKQLALGASLCGLLALSARAEDSPPQPAAKSTTQPAAQPAAKSTATPPAAAANAAQSATAPNTLQLDDKQKALMASWSKLQQEHLITSLRNQEVLEDLAAAETYDGAAVRKAAADMAKAEEAYYLGYAEKNRALVESLSAEQRKQFEHARKERKQTTAKRIEKFREIQNKIAPGKTSAP